MNNRRLSPPVFRRLSSLWLALCVALLAAASLLLAIKAQAAAHSPSAEETTLSAGEYHTCAIKSDSTLACWGENTYGQSTPPPGTFTQVSAGGRHTCGIQSDSTLACWGDNAWGQYPPPPGTFLQASAGGVHTCAVKSDGTLACWGDNSSGQSAPPPGTFTQVSAGDWHSCAVKSDGTLACWGYNVFGQATPPPGTFTQVSAGAYSTCGLKSDGSIVCWGTTQGTPPAGSFTQISAGLYHTCALKMDGGLVCWGYNDFGQSFSPPGVFNQVSGGRRHTCALMSDGAIACWGDPANGKVPLDITPAALPAGTPGQAYPQNLAVSGGSGPYSFSLAAGSLPAGLTLAADGAFNGTLPSEANIYVFTAQVRDSGTFPFVGFQAYTLTVDTLPVLTLPSSQAGSEGAPLAFTATASDPDPGQTLTFTLASGAPAGASITPGGNFAWTPPDNGVYTATVIVNDGLALDSETLQLTIANADPVLEPMGDQSGVIGVPVGFICQFSDPGASDTHSIHLEVQPGGGTGDFDVPSGEHSLALTFTGGASGAYTITATVTDNDGGTDTQAFNVNIIDDSNALPVLQAIDDQSVQVNALVAISGAFSDPDDAGAHTVGIEWEPGFVQNLDVAAGETSFNAGYTYTTPGDYTVTVTVTDELDASDTKTFIVHVGDEANTAPTLHTLNDKSVPANTLLSLSGAFDDPNAADTHTVSITWAPGVDQLIDLAAGVTSFNASHTYAALGDYTVTVTVSDQHGGTDTQTITVHVTAAGIWLYLPTITR